MRKLRVAGASATTGRGGMDLTLMTQLRSQSAQVFDDWARVPIRAKEVDDGPPPRNTRRIPDRVTPGRVR